MQINAEKRRQHALRAGTRRRRFPQKVGYHYRRYRSQSQSLQSGNSINIYHNQIIKNSILIELSRLVH